jgi:hypothetical protein
MAPPTGHFASEEAVFSKYETLEAAVDGAKKGRTE